ncbi:LysR family transcriptional regulator [Pseudonocardia eucalypti]|uniref:LysR family transcriptional regulator n=1 Tax=Pseudonocardia eucalypti TaxID=648755 RepID=A0ABP9QU43_9PSEU|nr:DNA-binding transcriptional LysR family regulator [Pseudonocardia eucalypti]
MDAHLRYFVAIAEHLHFTRAAEALYVSQPALSKQIRGFEQRLRVRLFDRDGRGVALTPAGAALLPGARAVLDAWAAAEADLAAATAVQRGTLRVGMSTGLGRGLLPAVRARLAELAPRIQLHVRQVGWGDPTGGLADAGGEGTDAAFVWLPLPHPERFAWLEVAREPRLVALPSAHPLADRAELDIAELLDQPFLALPASSGVLRDYWLATEARGGREPVVGAEVASVEETVECLAAGLGVCLLASGNAPALDLDGVAVRPVTGVGPSRLVLAWRRGDNREALRRLREATASAIGSGPAEGQPAR